METANEELEQFAGRDVEKATESIKGQSIGIDEKRWKDKPEYSNLEGEYSNIALLLLLYTLQGVPMGLSGVFPLVLKEKGVSFSDLGMFSMNSWPFSLKLLWAPIVDSAYIKCVGRRKTWMVPAQLLIGIVMMWVATSLNELLFVPKPAVQKLTALFFLLYFLCATQDIAVDGWALTMLRQENVSYAATCNSAGQTLGYALGFTGYMALEQFKLVTLSGFMRFWGLVFLVVTIFVAMMKREKPVPPEDEPEDIVAAYSQMVSMLRLKPVRLLIVVLFTWKASFGAEGPMMLKFQEYGVPKEHLAYISSLVMPVYIFLPLVVARWTAGSAPLDPALQAYPFRVALLGGAAMLLRFTPETLSPPPWGFYSLVLLLSLLAAVANQCIFVSQMAFFARVSDPAMGGTYMTMLNTLGNLGSMWPPTLCMYLIDLTTCKADTCILKRDGFYVVTLLCIVVGVAWYMMGAAQASRLQHHKPASWKVR